MKDGDPTRFRRLYEAARAKGLCGVCKRSPARPGRATCQGCAARNSINAFAGRHGKPVRWKMKLGKGEK